MSVNRIFMLIIVIAGVTGLFFSSGNLNLIALNNSVPSYSGMLFPLGAFLSLREFFIKKFKKSSRGANDGYQDDFLMGERTSKPVDFTPPQSIKSGQMAVNTNLILIHNNPGNPLPVPPRPSILEPATDEDDISVCPTCGSDIKVSEKACSVCGEEFE